MALRYPKAPQQESAPDKQTSDKQDAHGNAADNPAAENVTGSALSANSSAKEEKADKPANSAYSATGEYIYKKPQLRPEYRRMPGQWGKDNAKKQEEKKSEDTPKVNSSNENKLHENTPKRVDENGVVLLDNPIPHPERKTDHKEMEFKTDLSANDMDYDIAVSDDDDFDV